MQITLGTERIVMTDGLQPYLFRSSKGTLYIQAQLTPPPGYKPPEKNAFPGVAGNAVSRDNGQTWVRWSAAGDPTFFIEGAFLERSDGTIAIFEWVAAGPDENHNFTGRFWESRDDLQTLQGPIALTAHVPNSKPGFDDGGHPYHALTFHRSVIELPGGDLIATVYGWMHGDDQPVSYQPNMLKFRTMIVRSGDAGRTWRYVATICPPLTQTEEGVNESAMVRLKHGPHAGRLVCLMRTGSSNQPIYQCESDDDGQTWTPAHPIPFTGVDPDLIETHDGLLVASVGRRNWRPELADQRYYQLLISRDHGQSWELAAKWGLEPHAATDNLTSYSGLREIEPNRVLVAYDIGTWTMSVRYVATREVRIAR